MALIPTFEQIERHITNGFGPQVADLREKSGWSQADLAGHVVTLAGKEVGVLSEKIEQQRHLVAAEIEELQKNISSLKTLQKADRTTVRAWEKGTVVPDRIAATLLTTIFFGENGKDTPGGEAFLAAAATAQRNPNGFGDMLGDVIIDQKEASRLTSDELAAFIKEYAAEASQALEKRIEELKQQSEELSAFTKPSYLLIDGTGAEKHIEIQDIDKHTIKLLENGALPSSSLFGLLKDTFSKHGKASAQDLENLDEIYNTHLMSLALKGIDVRRFLTIEENGEEKPAPAAVRVAAPPVPATIVETIVETSPPVVTETPKPAPAPVAVAPKVEAPVEELPTPAAVAETNGKKPVDRNGAAPNVLINKPSKNAPDFAKASALGKSNDLVKRYAALYAQIFTEYELNPASFQVKDGVVHENDKNGSRSSLSQKTGDWSLSKTLRPFSLHPLEPNTIRALTRLKPQLKEVCEEYNKLTVQLTKQLFHENEPLQKAKVAVIKLLDELGFDEKKLAHEMILGIDQKKRVKALMDGHVPDIESTPDARVYFNQLSSGLFKEGSQCAFKSGKHGHGWNKAFETFFAAHASARDGYNQALAAFASNVADAASQMQVEVSENKQAREYINLEWMKKNAGSKMEFNEKKRYEELQARVDEDPDFAYRVENIRMQDKVSTKSNAAIGKP